MIAKKKKHKMCKKHFYQKKVIRNILSEIAFGINFLFNFTH